MGGDRILRVCVSWVKCNLHASGMETGKASFKSIPALESLPQATRNNVPEGTFCPVSYAWPRFLVFHDCGNVRSCFQRGVVSANYAMLLFLEIVVSCCCSWS